MRRSSDPSPTTRTALAASVPRLPSTTMLRCVATGAVIVALAVTVTAAAAPPTWGGRWLRLPQEAGWTGIRAFTLTQQGSRVAALHRWKVAAETYTAEGLVGCQTGTGGRLEGTVRGRTLHGTITWPDAKGILDLTLSRNGREITGSVRVVRGPCTHVFFQFNAVRRP